MDRIKRSQLATLALGALVAAAQPTFARPGAKADRQEDRREHQGHGDFGQGLDLTDSQKSQVKSILATAKPQIDAVRDNKNLTEDQREAQLKAIHQNTQAQINQILTPAQQQKLAARREERHEKGQGDRGKGRGMGGFAKQLNLTDAQQAQIKSIFGATRPQIEALRDNKSLTQEQREAQIKTIHQNAFAQVSQILTPEQRTKMQSLRSEHREDRSSDRK